MTTTQVSSWQREVNKKFIRRSNLASAIKGIRSDGQSIVTINGSFDLMHAGHLHMLHEASLQADCLIVALNTDESIRSYKGPERPIIPLNYRMEMMAALGFVDYVTSFSEGDPCAILEVIRPEVHVNGPEWGEDCIEASVVKRYGGRVHIVDLIPGLSTSEIIRKIRSLELGSPPISR